MTHALAGLGCLIFIDTHCKPNKSLELCQQPNKFLVSLSGILTVFSVWIDILLKKKFANWRKKNKNILFVNIALFLLFLVCFYLCFYFVSRCVW